MIDLTAAISLAWFAAMVIAVAVYSLRHYFTDRT